MYANVGEVWLKREDSTFAVLFPNMRAALNSAKENQKDGIISALYDFNSNFIKCITLTTVTI